MTRAPIRAGRILILAAAITTAATTAAASGLFDHYRTENGPRVSIRADCLSYEDTAAHLRLVDYGEHRIRYSCYRTGY